MPRVVVDWLADHVAVPHGTTAEQLAADLVKVGIEEEAIIPAAVTGPLVVGRVLAKTSEPQKNGKTINWCRVDVGPAHNDADGGRGIVCGAHNFGVGDLVVVALPGTVLPGPFEISARKTYGHVSDGMICSTSELGLGDDGSGGIIVLPGNLVSSEVSLTPGQDAKALLGLDADVLEVNITPDRGYQFSYRGVAREYANATGGAFTDPGLAANLKTAPPTATPDGFQVQVQDRQPIHGQVGCDRFVTRIVRGIDPGAPTPAWMKQRLEASGMRSISLAVDVTNYVMLDLGQPLHAYDLAKVAEPIVVRRAEPGEKLTTLDDVERKLDPEDLLITDSPGGVPGSRVLGIAGVMGGASSEVTAATTDVLVEAAHFDPVTVARSARRHKLPSEAAKRFERGVDPQLPPVAAQRVVDYLVAYGGGHPDPAVTDLNQVHPVKPIDFPLDLPSRVVGVDYSREQVLDVLRQIGCTVGEPDAAGHALVTPPTWRPDLLEPVDLVEEVARVRGYDQIPSVLPTAPGSSGLPRGQRVRRSVARTLAEAGLVETLAYPFVGAADFDAVGIADGDQRRDAVQLANPLSDDQPGLRTELILTVLDTARRNVARGLADFGVYEVGLVTEPGGSLPVAPVPPLGHLPSAADLAAIHAAVPNQPWHVAGVLVGARQATGWWGAGRQVSWTDAVELARLVADRIGVAVELQPESDHLPWHPGRTAKLVVSDGAAAGTVVGVAGELHPKVAERLDLPARSVAFEVNLSALESAGGEEAITAVPVSAFPAAKEDFAFVLESGVPAESLRAAIERGAGDLVEDVTLFDVYTGDQVPGGHKSLAFSVRLRAADRTLTAEEVKAARSRVIDEAAKLGATLRA